MAGNNRVVIQNLLERVEELSEIISPRSTASVNSEVRAVFSQETSFPSISSNQETLPSRTNVAQSAPSQALPSSSENRLPVRRNTPFQARRYFPAARPTTNPQNRRRGNRAQRQTTDNRPFLRDLILLSGPEDEIVPRQGTRLVLTENGHIISGVRFTKDLSAAAVEICIIEAYNGKIPSDVDFEIMTSVHSRLTTPNLAPGQLLDGVMIHRIFRQKPLYIRPSRCLLDIGDEKQLKKLSGIDELEDPILHDHEISQHGTSNSTMEDVLQSDTDNDLLAMVGISQEPERLAETFPVHHLQETMQPEVTIENNLTEPITTIENSMGIQWQPRPAVERPVRNIIVHRATIRSDMIAIFKDPNVIDYNIYARVIDMRGREETGEGDGVMRDVLTQFWHEVYDSLTTGASERTPIIRHDMQKDEWQALARVIVYGFCTLDYFPLKISPIIISTCLFGEEVLSKQFLLEAFRKYITSEDQRILDACLSDDCNANDDDVIDFLTSWKCCRIPNNENIKEIIFELAHQELVQKPRYILNCWAPIIKMLQFSESFQTPDGVLRLFMEKQPTAKKVIKALEVETTNEIQRSTMDHLRRFIRSLEGKAIERFVHFITGADCLTGHPITVTFNSLSGLQRRPIVHTCAPTIEVPTTYESYADVASEFNNILKENQAWSFDII